MIMPNIEDEVFGLEKSKTNAESSKATCSHGKKPKWRAYNRRPKNILGQSPGDEGAITSSKALGQMRKVVEEDEEYHIEEVGKPRGQ